jgi:hypothetical protein
MIITIIIIIIVTHDDSPGLSDGYPAHGALPESTLRDPKNAPA